MAVATKIKPLIQYASEESAEQVQQVCTIFGKHLEELCALEKFEMVTVLSWWLAQMCDDDVEDYDAYAFEDISDINDCWATANGLASKNVHTAIEFLSGLDPQDIADLLPAIATYAAATASVEDDE